ncbi:MAG: TldD/PmbA family protein [Candidatus Atabeyarchaeum deiterrae]
MKLITDELIEKTEHVVEKARNLGATEVIAEAVVSRDRQIRYSNNQIDISQNWRDLGIHLVLTVGKKVVATEIKRFDDIDQMVGKVISIAKSSKDNPLWGGLAKGEFKYETSKADDAIRKLDDPAKYVHKAIDAALSEGAKNTGGVLRIGDGDSYLLSSEGPSGYDTESYIEFSMRAFTNELSSGHAVECSSSVADFHPEKAGRNAAEIARNAEKFPRQELEEGAYDVIFDPLIFGALLTDVGGSASAFMALAQLSCFVGKVGQKVASDKVTVHDYASPTSMGHRTFDDEGVPIKNTLLIDHGVYKTFLHNTSTAKLFKTETTGNAGIVMPTAFTLQMDPGDYKLEELFSEVKDGLYLTNTWYTRFQNYMTGDFSTVPRDGAFIVKDGEIKASTANLRISDNLLRVLLNVEGVTRERHQVRWWGEVEIPAFSPTVLSRKVKITKSK